MKFEGQCSLGEKWNGINYNYEGFEEFEFKEGKGKGKEYDYYGIMVIFYLKVNIKTEKDMEKE